MTDQPQELERISAEDVQAVTERLRDWGQALPEQEQLVLGWVLTRAAAAGDAHVDAYAERAGGGVPVSALMAQAAGLREPDDVSGYAIPIHGYQPAVGQPPPTWAFRW